MSIDMYGPKVAEASALIREFAKTEYFHYFQGDPEKALEQFIAMLDQAEEKGQQSQAERIAALEREVAELSEQNQKQVAVLQNALVALENGQPVRDTNRYEVAFHNRAEGDVRAILAAAASSAQDKKERSNG